MSKNEPYEKRLLIEKHLIDDYKDIQNKSAWGLNGAQTLQMIGSILLPVISILVRLIILN